VVTQTVKNAKQQLQQLGFTNIQFANGSDQSDNAIVTGIDPGAGNTVDPSNTTITLTTVGTGNNNGGNNNGGTGFFGGNSG
jgi:beta-lactam-binding protein with PASTA domain